tara:strand:- start:1975 stop:2847 length:873 start_codon:yes stop_codon:yes gene_type:complete
MIIDCFPFFNELDLLDIRLKLLDDIVDKIVLVESTRTFTLTKKRLFYNENKNRYKKYKDKIIHIIVDDSPALFNKFFIHKPKNIFWLLKNKKSILLNAHDIDFYQKNQVYKGLQNCDENDILILSDLDEIPNPSIFKNLETLKEGRSALELDLYCYFLNGKVFNTENKKNIKWIGPSITQFKNFRSFHAERSEARNSFKKENKFKKVKNAGWHFTYLGGLKSLNFKIKSTAHTELNTRKINTQTNLKKLIDSGTFVGNKKWKAIYSPLESIFPEYLCNLFYEYPNLIKAP